MIVVTGPNIVKEIEIVKLLKKARAALQRYLRVAARRRPTPVIDEASNRRLFSSMWLPEHLPSSRRSQTATARSPSSLRNWLRRADTGRPAAVPTPRIGNSQ
jgi:hypothetical protein